MWLAFLDSARRVYRPSLPSNFLLDIPTSQSGARFEAENSLTYNMIHS